MAVVVQKFGGSSVGDVEKIRRVAQKVKATREAGKDVVVVVSAMGDTTDELLALAKKVSADPPRRELDMLLTCGERISMALLSMALWELGVPAISFTGSQSGIITDNAHAQASIVEVRPERIVRELSSGKVVIVAGYQGVSRSREVTTLGRGGSDTSAVALAAALEAEACEIYSDVDGVWSADPRVVLDAKRLDGISYQEMQELAAHGAKVLNASAVEFAKQKNIVVHARSTFGGGQGTVVQQSVQGQQRVKAVAGDVEVAVLFLQSPEVLPSLLEQLDARGVRGRTLTQLNAGSGGLTCVVLPLQDLHGLDSLRRELADRFGAEVVLRDDLGTVTAVGDGIHRDWALVRRALAAAALLKAEIVGLETSALAVTVVTGRQHVAELTRRLHQELIG